MLSQDVLLPYARKPDLKLTLATMSELHIGPKANMRPGPESDKSDTGGCSWP